MLRRLPLALILLAYLLAGALYAIYTPDWQAPDEPAHYNYIRQLAAGRLPVIEPGDYDEAYRSQVVASGFDPQYSIAPLTYEDWQPPLYYLLQVPLFRLFDGALLPLRLFSVLLGAGVVCAAYAVGRRLLPDSYWPALAMAAFVAFVPQHVAILASVNNDSLAELLIGLALWLLLVLARLPAAAPDPGRRWLLLGVLLGLAFVTKATTYILVPVTGLVILARYRRQWPEAARVGLLVLLPALAIGSIWWMRNSLVYGGLDILAMAAHDEAVVGQTRTAEYVDRYGVLGTVEALIATTFRSFWGQFGWMAVPMPDGIYLALLFFSLLTTAGVLFALVAYWRRADQRALPVATLVLGSALLFSVAVYLYYNVTFIQHQGRYLYSALIPISALVAGGWAALLRPMTRRWPAAGYLLPLLLGATLLALDLTALFRFVVPYL
jgi:4-amino-4-deoxy-L-arabinose transferase-like glycosyltransferase